MLESKQEACNENEKFWKLVPTKLNDYQIAIQGLKLQNTANQVYEFSGEVFAEGVDGDYLVSIELLVSRGELGTTCCSVKIQTDLAQSKQTFFTINECLKWVDGFSGLKYDKGHYWLSNLHVGTDLAQLGRLVNDLATKYSYLASVWLSVEK